ncbi:MAG: HAD hydrolase-like protein [Spirochaetia bacterium]|nr:HAD hydrolase-like protein [Spirochaetia bacterium]
MNLLVFDMDGVLVDVSASYREATRQAAYIFLKGCKGGDLLKAPLFSLSELAAVKQSGGLNNDWDMTHRVISLLLVMAENAGGFTERTQWDVEPLARYLDSTERPLSAIMESGHLSKAADAYYAGDVGSGNVIKQIFQEIYLGQELFTRTYGFAPQYCKQEGLILKEKLFTPKELLKKLAESGTLAIATGRPRSEALYPLEKHGLDMFSTVVSLDECEAEEKRILEKTGCRVARGKPDPFMLDYIASLYPEAEKLYYFGDVGDDMKAAKNSRYHYIAVGIAYSAPDKDLASHKLTECGADILIHSPDELIDIFGGSHV